MQHFLELEEEDWRAYLQNSGQPKFRAQQIWQWIYEKKTAEPIQMANLPKALVADLQRDFSWQLPQEESRLEGSDGSTKLLLRTPTGLVMEAVILRYPGRVSLCVSSQVGCRMACSFCQTGKLGFMRNLSAADILSQYFLAEKIVAAEGRRVSHVVYMGMGEPLDNLEPVIKSVNRLLDPKAFGLSKRHVTVSTSGLVPKLMQFIERSEAAIAISLHAAEDGLRTQLMPINKRYPLAALKEAMLYYRQKSQRRITIEYILIKGLNTELKHAKQLVSYLHGLAAKVNLIPFNEHPGLDYGRPDDEEIRRFQRYLAERSIAAPVRYSKGADVSAACGQLAAKTCGQLADKPTRQSLLPA